MIIHHHRRWWYNSMTLQEYQHGMLIDCIGDSQMDFGFFLLFRKMCGERVNPDLVTW